MAQPSVEQLFQAADKPSADGALDEAELGWLICAVNPDVPLSEEALGLIAGELLATFPATSQGAGLTLEGLQRLYAEGHADPERDFQLLMQYGADEAAAAAAALELPGSAAKRQKLGAEADSSVATTLASARKSGVLTPRDVFDDLATPAPAAAAGTIGTAVAVATLGATARQPGGVPPATPGTARSDAFDFLVTPADSSAFRQPAGLPGLANAQHGVAAGGDSQPVTPAGDVFDGLFTPATAAAGAAAAGSVAFGRPVQVPALHTGALPGTARGGVQMSDMFDSVQTPMHGAVHETLSQEVVAESLVQPTAAAQLAAAGPRRAGFVLDATALMESSSTAADSYVGHGGAPTPASVVKPASRLGQPSPPTAADAGEQGGVLAFALTLPPLAGDEHFSEEKQAALLAALQEALPAGSHPSILANTAVSTPHGLVVPVVCTPAAAHVMRQQLQQAPQRVFAPLTFGAVDVTVADVEAAGSCEAALAAAVSVAVAAAAPANGAEAQDQAVEVVPLSARSVGPAGTAELPASVTFSMAVPGTTAGAPEQQELFVSALQEALPPGSSACIKHVATTPAGVLITAAADVPAEAADAVRQLQYQLEQEPRSVFRPAAFAGARLVALRAKAKEAMDEGQQVLAFSLTLPDVSSPAVFQADKEAKLVAAIQDSMPDGSVASIRSTAATPYGLLVSVLVELPQHTAPAQAAEAVQQLRNASATVLPPATFGQVSVTAADVEAAGSAGAAADAAAATAAALSTLEADSTAHNSHAVAFTVALSDTRERAAFQPDAQAELVSAVETALPEGSSVKISTVTPSARALLVTVAAELPRSNSNTAEVAAYVANVLQHEPAQVLSPAKFGAVKLVAVETGAAPPAPTVVVEEAADAASDVQEFSARQQVKHAQPAAAAGLSSPAAKEESGSPLAPALAPMSFTLALPGLAETDLQDATRRQQLLAALEDALPAGCAAVIQSISPTLNGGALVTLTSEVPAHEAADAQVTLAARVPELLAPAFGPAVVAAEGVEESMPSTVVDAMAAALEEAAQGGRAALAVTLAVPAGTVEEDVVAEALLHMLPPGASLDVKPSSQASDGSLVITATAVLPPTADTVEQVQRALNELQATPTQALALPSAGPICVLAAEVKAAEFVPLEFSLQLPEASNEHQLVASVEAALPLGAAVCVGSISAVENGTLVAVVQAQLPAYELAAGQAASAQLVQQYEAAAAKAAARRAEAETTARAEAQQQAEEEAASTNSAACIDAAEGGWPALVFSVHLPEVEPAALEREHQAMLLAEVQAQLPQGSAVKVSRVVPAPAGGVIVTIGARLPASTTAAAQADQLMQQLRSAPSTVLPAVLGSAALLATDYSPVQLVQITFQLPLAEPADEPAAKAQLQQDVQKHLCASLPDDTHVSVNILAIEPAAGGARVLFAAEVPAVAKATAEQGQQQLEQLYESRVAAALAEKEAARRAAEEAEAARKAAEEAAAAEAAEAARRAAEEAAAEKAARKAAEEAAAAEAAEAARRAAEEAAAEEAARKAAEEAAAAEAAEAARKAAEEAAAAEAAEEARRAAEEAAAEEAARKAAEETAADEAAEAARKAAEEAEAARKAAEEEAAAEAAEAARRAAEEAARKAAEEAAAAEATTSSAARAAGPLVPIVMTVEEFNAHQRVKHAQPANAPQADAGSATAVDAAAMSAAGVAALASSQTPAKAMAQQPAAASSKKSGGLFSRVFSRSKKSPAPAAAAAVGAAPAALATESVAAAQEAPHPAEQPGSVAVPVAAAAVAATTGAAMLVDGLAAVHLEDAAATGAAAGQASTAPTVADNLPAQQPDLADVLHGLQLEDVGYTQEDMAAAAINLEAQMEAAALQSPSPPPAAAVAAGVAASAAAVAAAAGAPSRQAAAPAPSELTDFFSAREQQTAATNAPADTPAKSTAGSHAAAGASPSPVEDTCLVMASAPTPAAPASSAAAAAATTAEAAAAGTTRAEEEEVVAETEPASARADAEMVPQPSAQGVASSRARSVPASSPLDPLGSALPMAGSVAGAAAAGEYAVDEHSTFAAGLGEEAHIARLVAELAAGLEGPEGSLSIADIIRIQREASALPGWAAHKAHMELGFRLNARQRYREALYSFQAAVKVEAVDPLAHFRIGNALFALRKYSEARKAYVKALKCCQRGDGAGGDELAVKIYVNLGITQEAEGLLMSACDYYKQAVTLKPDHHRAFKLMGSALYALGDFDGAKTALKSSLALKPDYADAHCDLGCTYCAQGDVDNAKKCFKAAIASNPAHLEAHFNMGNLLRQCAEFDRAIRSYDAVLAIDPGHWRSLLNKAVVQTCTGYKNEAAGNLKAALKLSGQGSALAQEVDQLKKMLKQGAAWDVISQMMSYISDKAAQVESLAAGGGMGPDGTPQSKPSSLSPLMGGRMAKLMGGSASRSHKGSRQKLARLGVNIGEAVQQVDVPMLQQLQPLAEAKVADLLAEAVDANTSRSKRGKWIKVTRAESLVRRILAATPPAKFQHMMRTINSQVLVLLDTKRTGYVDLGLLLMCLMAVSDQPVMDRLEAAYKIQEWRKAGEPVTRRDGFDYVAALRVIFSPGHEPEHWEGHEPTPTDGHFLALQRWATAVTEGFPLFEALPLLAKPLA